MTQEEAAALLPGHTVFNRGDRLKVLETRVADGVTQLRLKSRGWVNAVDCDTTADKPASLMVTFGIFPVTQEQRDELIASGLVVSRGRSGGQEDLREAWNCTGPKIRELLTRVLGKQF